MNYLRVTYKNRDRIRKNDTITYENRSDAEKQVAENYKGMGFDLIAGTFSAKKISPGKWQILSDWGKA